jgi:hypothetical protein
VKRARPFATTSVVLALVGAGFAAAVGAGAGGCSTHKDVTTSPAPPDSGALTTAQLKDPTACANCHAEHYAQWSGSMHAYASVDPLFVAMNARAQRETNGALGAFCVQCHAPMAVRLGATKTGLDLADASASARGVTCYFCHSVDAVNGTSDDPLHLATDGVLRADISDPVATAAHPSMYSALHDQEQAQSASLCGACHDVTIASGALPIEQTFAEWKTSIYAVDTKQALLTCGGCHMQGTEGTAASPPNVVPQRMVHDHSVPGVDPALIPFPEADAQAALVQTSLDPVITAQLCVQQPDAGDTTSVTLDDAFVGHDWPSGAVHDRRAWVEIIATSSGQTVFTSGVVPNDQTSVETIGDPNLWLLKETLLDANNDPVLFMWQATTVQPSALPPTVTNDPSDPRYQHSVTKMFPVPASADDVKMRVRILPVAVEVVQALIQSGDLDASYLAKLRALTLSGTQLEWNKSVNGYGCVP